MFKVRSIRGDDVTDAGNRIDRDDDVQRVRLAFQEKRAAKGPSIGIYLEELSR